MTVVINGTTGITTPKLDALDLELGSKNVVERGSNANGDYVRFADGTQICTSPRLPVNDALSLHVRKTNWTFPATFYAIPTCIGNYEIAIGSGGRAKVSHVAGATSTSNGFIAVAADSGVDLAAYANPANGSLTATGRWF